MGRAASEAGEVACHRSPWPCWACWPTRRSRASAAQTSAPTLAAPGGQPPRPAGGLDDLLRGGLGGAGLGAGLGGLGAILSNGLGDLLKQFQGAGKGDVANSWVASGENKPIAPADIGKVLTPEQIEFLTERTGLSREELLAGLADQLPKAVNSLTPEGRIPAPQDMNRVAELS